MKKCKNISNHIVYLQYYKFYEFIYKFIYIVIYLNSKLYLNSQIN